MFSKDVLEIASEIYPPIASLACIKSCAVNSWVFPATGLYLFKVLPNILLDWLGK